MLHKISTFRGVLDFFGPKMALAVAYAIIVPGPLKILEMAPLVIFRVDYTISRHIYSTGILIVITFRITISMKKNVVI